MIDQEKNLIECVRRRLSDEGKRIAAAPIPFNHAWWPHDYPDVKERLLSDYGVPSGPTLLNGEFDAEVKAIHECLDKLGHVPNFAEWQKSDDARRLFSPMNQRSVALSVWEDIAFPLRRIGDVVFRVSAPRDVMTGRPIIDALPVDDFIRSVSSQSVRDKQEIARLHTHLRWWRTVAVSAGAAALLIAIACLA